MKAKSLLLLAALSLLSGCATVTIDVTESGGENRIAASDVTSIAIDRDSVAKPFPFFSGADERLENGAVWDTAKVWPRVFVGNSDSIFRVESARMVATMEAATFVNRYTFRVEGTLEHKGRTFPVSASGSRAAAMNVTSAARQAVELAAVDAARKCQAIIAQMDAPRDS